MNRDLSKLIEAARRSVGDHVAPNDCYATGPLTGDYIKDLVECPACSLIAMCDALSAAKAATQRLEPSALQQAINDAHNKVLAATRCHPNAVEWLVREALEILGPHATKPAHPQGEGEK